MFYLIFIFTGLDYLVRVSRRDPHRVPGPAPPAEPAWAHPDVPRSRNAGGLLLPGARAVVPGAAPLLQDTR